MKISYNILTQLVPGLTLSPSELAEMLTLHSFETVIDREYVIDPSITVVKILKLDPHPNADRLRLATVDMGERGLPAGRQVRVVCGAPNIAEGQIVPYAPPGAQVYDEKKELFTLKDAVIRGENSPGMLNSSRELGMSDEHGGIVILPEGSVVGSKLADCIPSDTILDVSVLPDRAADANTHVGIAREVAALTRLSVQEVQPENLFFLLLQKITGISDMGSFEVISPSLTRSPISFDARRPSRVAGVEISIDEVRDILQRLRFTIEEDGDSWAVLPPADRVDVTGEHDLEDEVVRFHGLDSIPTSKRMISSTGVPVSSLVYWTNEVKNNLASLGFTETYSYSFEDEKFAQLVNVEIHPHVELVNPMAPELKKLRYSMLPGLLSAMVKSRDDIHRNKKGQERALFEIGRVYHVAREGEQGVVPGVIERPVVAGIAVGDESSLRGVIDSIREMFGIESLTISSRTQPFGTVSFLKYADEFFGITYVLNDELLKKMKYRMPVVAFELSLNALVKHAKEVEIPVLNLEEIRNKKGDPVQFQELPKYPSVFRDISLLVDPSIGIDSIESEITRVGGNMAVDVELFDEYFKEGDEKKSLAFHIEYRLSEKTLTDAEVDAVHKKIEDALKKVFNAQVR